MLLAMCEFLWQSCKSLARISDIQNNHAYIVSSTASFD